MQPIHPDYDDFAYVITRSSNFEFRHVVRDRATGDPIDITGWGEGWLTGKFDLDDDDDEAVFQLTKTGAGILFVTPSVGLVEFRIIPAHTSGLTNERTALYVDYQQMDDSGRRRTLALGSILVTPESTLATV